MSGLVRVPCRFGSEACDVYSDQVFATLFEREFFDDRVGRTPDTVMQIFRSYPDFLVAKTFLQDKSTSVEFSNEIADFTLSFAEKTRVIIHLRKTRRMKLAYLLPSFIQKLMTQKYVTAHEQEYGHVLYGAVLWIVFVAGLRKSKIFLHASGFQWNDRCVLLCGGGGVGKTAISRYFFEIADVGFISDDLVCVDVNGIAYPNSMLVHVYPYGDMDQTLEGLLRARFSDGWMDRMHWTLRKTLFGSKGVCRRVSPFELYRCRLATANCRLTDLVWLDRGGSEFSAWSDVTPESFATAHLHVLQTEMAGAFTFFRQAIASGWDPHISGLPADLSKHVHDMLKLLAEKVTVRKFSIAKGSLAKNNARELMDRTLSRAT